MSRIQTHYDNLKVARDAPQEVIRAAYKTLSQKYHPDRHPGDPKAAGIMSILNTSYDVLSDPVKRRAHDLWIAQQERRTEQRSSFATPEPAPTPRARAPRAWTVLSHVIRYWLVYGLAGLMLWAIYFAEPPVPPEGPKPYQATAPEPPGPTCSPLDSAPEIYRCEYADGVRSYRRTLPAGATFVKERPSRESAPKNREDGEYVRPIAAPNGRSWPSKAGYVEGYARSKTTGLSSVTVDNSRNDSDVFVKLVSLDSDRAYPVRHIFIPAFGEFRASNVGEGSYDVRYRDLDTGGLSRSEAFTLEETPANGGIQYSEITLTLYKVQDGNMQTFPLGESEF